MTLDELKVVSPFPWRTEMNWNGPGTVRMLDAANKEVSLFHITGLAQYASSKFLEEGASPQPQNTGAGVT